MRKTTTLQLQTRSWVEEGLRECHIKNQLEEIGITLQSAKKKKKKTHQEELGRKGQRNSQKKQQSGEKGALEKEHNNHEKELGNLFLFLSQRKSHRRNNM